MNEHVKADEIDKSNDKTDKKPPPDPYTILLSKPLETHSGAVSVVKLRELNAGDFIDVNGLPFSMNGTGETKLDFKIALQWLSRLSGIDELILRKLPHRDWMKAVASINIILTTEGDTVGNSIS